MTFDEEFVPPPDNPPKVKLHGRPQDLPEEVRRVFGTNPAPNTTKPKPPPPPPPNSYHKKPKYWQMRGTGHMSQTNRIAGISCGFLCVISLLLYKFNDCPQRLWSKFLGFDEISSESIEADRRKNELFWQMVRNIPEESFETNLTGEHYTNLRKKDKSVRWDLREVDLRVMGTRDMANPSDDAI